MVRSDHMGLLDDADDAIFRSELDQATIATTAFDLPAIARQVAIIAARYGRCVRCLRVARRTAPIEDPASPKINCHAFALGLHTSQAFREIGRFPESDFIASLLESGLLALRPLETVRERDLVLYRNEQQITHSGIAFPPEIESKWGEGSVFRHSLFAVPSRYGSAVNFYAPPEFAAVESAYRAWFQLA